MVSDIFDLFAARYALAQVRGGGERGMIEFKFESYSTGTIVKVALGYEKSFES